ncbi:MAG: hypothetical protein EXX96DRAFT_590387 [Benjaminiella poitrasii]|nr:MAG: hypothetical protein EXX96DRAFT_590387 [Benjaminiella poitrasii]
MEEEEEEQEHFMAKRYFNLHTQFSPNQPLDEKNLPAITYASPDYRPPPPNEAPLWAQPVYSATPTAANSPLSTTEDDSEEDDSALLTPLYHQQQQQQQQQLQQQQQSVLFNNNNSKSNVDYWGDMMIDQWQQ